MKLAEALLLRADLKKKLASLRDRLTSNAVVQEGDKPHEDPEMLLREAVSVAQQLADLATKVDTANLQHKVADGRSLLQLLAEREVLMVQHSLLTAAINGTKKEPDRYSMKEIKWVSTFDVAGYQRRLEDLSKNLRELNALIQQANWLIEF